MVWDSGVVITAVTTAATARAAGTAVVGMVAGIMVAVGTAVGIDDAASPSPTECPWRHGIYLKNLPVRMMVP